jgi:hypothetical protein
VSTRRQSLFDRWKRHKKDAGKRFKRSRKVRDKISDTLAGRPHTPEHRAAISEAMREHWKTSESRQRPKPKPAPAPPEPVLDEFEDDEVDDRPLIAPLESTPFETPPRSQRRSDFIPLAEE